MRHLDAAKAGIWRLLRRTRTIALVGASPDPAQHSHTVAAYLNGEGYDVIPVRPDRAPVAGVASYGRLTDFGGPVDLVVIYRTPAAVVPHIDEAAAKQAEAVWLPPGAWSPAAEETAKRHGLLLVKERCILEAHRELRQLEEHPQRLGVHISRRRTEYEDNRPRPEDRGYVARGGGGPVAGGGVRSILDEKKMVKGRPSRRSGPMKPRRGRTG